MMWAGSLKSAYMVTVTFVFAGPISRVLNYVSWPSLSFYKEKKKVD